MEDNEEFRELADNFLWLLRLLQKLSPLSLQTFHNKINEYAHKK